MIPPIILETGEVVRVSTPLPPPPTPYTLERLYHRGRTIIAAVTMRPAPAPYETDGRKHGARFWGRPAAAWRRVTGRP